MKGTHIQRAHRLEKNGFTLLEMIVVLGIIGLILGVSVTALSRAGNSAEIKTTQIMVQGLATNLREYRMLGGTYPSQQQGLEALVKKPTTAPVPDQHTQLRDEIPVDPWTTPLQYKFPGSKDPRTPEIISAGPDAEFGTDDDISSQD